MSRVSLYFSSERSALYKSIQNKAQTKEVAESEIIFELLEEQLLNKQNIKPTIIALDRGENGNEYLAFYGERIYSYHDEKKRLDLGDGISFNLYRGEKEKYLLTFSPGRMFEGEVEELDNYKIFSNPGELLSFIANFESYLDPDHISEATEELGILASKIAVEVFDSVITFGTKVSKIDI